MALNSLLKRVSEQATNVMTFLSAKPETEDSKMDDENNASDDDSFQEVAEANGESKDLHSMLANDEVKPEVVAKKKKKGGKADAKKENKDEKVDDAPAADDKKPKKALKKTIPAWASVDPSKKTMAVSAGSGLSSGAVIVEAIRECADGKGHASINAMRRFAKVNNPQWPKMTFKKALQRAIKAERIVQVTGKGMAGSFKLAAKKNKQAAAKTTKSKKGGKAAPAEKPALPLEEHFANAFCWIADPKEASFGMIRKYLLKHYPQLDVEGKAFKNAIEAGIAKGQLQRLTGSGASGTLALVNEASKFGSKYEDAIEEAIIAMNEPKDASIAKIRDYLGEYYKEYKTDSRPKVLLGALERAESRGHITRLSGKGFTGKFKLSFPYYPAPKELWGEWYEGESSAAKQERKKTKSRYAEASSDEDESADEEEQEEQQSDDSDAEPTYVPRKKKRGPPSERKAVKPKSAKKRALPTPQKKKALKTPQKKKK